MNGVAVLSRKHAQNWAAWTTNKKWLFEREPHKELSLEQLQKILFSPKGQTEFEKVFGKGLLPQPIMKKLGEEFITKLYARECEPLRITKYDRLRVRLVKEMREKKKEDGELSLDELLNPYGRKKSRIFGAILHGMDPEVRNMILSGKMDEALAAAVAKGMSAERGAD